MVSILATLQLHRLANYGRILSMKKVVDMTSQLVWHSVVLHKMVK